jgi:predicted pyridoxine 5'-phosphate oxidase superfamily flavin-nucleotide-binding protein
MVDWEQFAREAPRIAEVFVRRHSATGKLCMLATVRADGSPRISPMEPLIFDGRLVLVGMPNTSKFRDLERDPRFELHTATVDPYVGDGDAKVWGEARNVQDGDLHARFAQDLFDESGMDLRGQEFDPFFVVTLRARHRSSSGTAS